MKFGYRALLSIAILGFCSWTSASLALDHSGAITSDETWSAADNPHVVTANVTVNAGVTLTLDAGVEVQFNSSTRINVYGTLDANGTSGNTILFTRAGAGNGTGLRFINAGDGNLDYCVIEYCTYGIYQQSTGALAVTDCTFQNNNYGYYAIDGDLYLLNSTFQNNTSTGYYGAGVAPILTGPNTVFANNPTGIEIHDVSALVMVVLLEIRDSSTVGLKIVDCTDVSLNNLTLTGNTGTFGAIQLSDVGEFTLGAANTIGGGGLENSWPVTITAGCYPAAGAVVPTSGNTNNAIQVTGGASARSGVWRKFTDLDYVIAASPTISAGGSLTIEAGVHLLHNASTRLNIYGALTAIGAPGNEIVFSRSGTSNGAGLRFLTAGVGTLDHCLFEYSTYGIYHSSSGTVSVANTTSSDNTYGMYATDGAIELTNVLVQNNASYGFYGAGAPPTFMDGNSVFDNCATGIELHNIAGLSLTDEVMVRNNSSAGLKVIDCSGVFVDNMTLTGNTGSYGAIQMNNVGEFNLGPGNSIGGMGLENSWPVTINIGSYPAAGITIPTTGNTNNDIQVYGGSSADTGTWRKFADLDYIVAASPTISAGGSLTIEPGVNVLHNASTRLSVYGQLTAVGTAGNEIVFTRSGTSNGSGLRFLTNGSGVLEHCLLNYATYGLYNSSAGTVEVTDTILENNTYGIYATDGVVELTRVTIRDNSSYGYYGSGVVPTFQDDLTLIENCATGIELHNIAGLVLDDVVTVINNATVGVRLIDCTGVAVDNLVLTGNTGTRGAISVEDAGEFTLGAGNTIGGSGLENSWPLTITMGSYPAEGIVIPTTGNTNNDIQVYGGSSDRTGVWRKFTDLDFAIISSPTVSAGGMLTIEPGVNVLHNASTRLSIYGELAAIGAPGNEIIFTRRGASNASGTRFLTAGSGVFEHCLLEYGTYGLYNSSSGTVSVINSTIQNGTYGVYASNGVVEFTNTLVQDNASYGYYGAGTVPVFLDNQTVIDNCATGIEIHDVDGLVLNAPATVRNNATAGVRIVDCEDVAVDELVLTGNTGLRGAIVFDDVGEFEIGENVAIGGDGLENSWPVTIMAGSYPAAGTNIPWFGNTNDDIQVYGGQSARSGTWRRFEKLDYIVNSSTTISAGGSLDIAGGVAVRFGVSATINIYGSLVADGSTTNRVLFTQHTSNNGGGLYFHTSGTGLFNRCIIQHFNYGIRTTSSGTVDITDCLIRYCNYGIYASAGTVTLLNNRIVDNDNYGIYLLGATPVFGSNEDEWNDVHGNGTGQPGRDLYNGPTDIDAIYVYWGTVDPVEIEYRIWHQADSAALGVVNYSPWSTQHHDTVSGTPDDGADEENLPKIFELSQNYPNPFNPMTTIEFGLPTAVPVRLTIYDVAGRLVSTLVDGPLAAGHHRLQWRGVDDRQQALASGVYFYRIDAGDFNQIRRMMLVR